MEKRINWVRKLLDDQKGKLLDNQKEKLLDKQKCSNQPNQLQTQFVTDRGDLITCKVEETRPVLKRSMLILSNEELSSSDRTGRLVETEVNQTRSSEDNKSLNVEQTHDRSGQLDKHIVAVQDDREVFHEIRTLNTNNEFNRVINEEDIDFNIPGLPHSTVKQLHGASVRELIQIIENHPNRHALQRDLRQSHSFHPFSQESKKMIHEVENIELCELLDTEPKTQCKVCLSYWDIRIVYRTCGQLLTKRKRGKSEIHQIIRWTFFQFRSTSSRKDDLTDIDMVKSRETGNTLRLTN